MPPSRALTCELGFNSNFRCLCHLMVHGLLVFVDRVYVIVRLQRPGLELMSLEKENVVPGVEMESVAKSTKSGLSLGGGVKIIERSRARRVCSRSEEMD